MINPQFLYQDDHMMTYSDKIPAMRKNYKVIQVQMYKDEKIWAEMGSAVEVKKLGKNKIYSGVIKKFSF